MKAKLLATIICLALMLAVPGAQAATLIYANGAPDDWSGTEMAAALPAEYFSFTSPQTVTNVRFWAVADTIAGPPSPGQYYGSIDWQICSNNSGVPGTVLAYGTASPNISYVREAIFSGPPPPTWGQEYQLDFSLGTPVSLSANTTYWLVLHNGPMDTAAGQVISNYYWVTTSPGGSMAYAVGNGDGTWGDWQPYTGRDGYCAFQLWNGNPVPLPGAVWLLGSGLLGLIGLRKKLRS